MKDDGLTGATNALHKAQPGTGKEEGESEGKGVKGSRVRGHKMINHLAGALSPKSCSTHNKQQTTRAEKKETVLEKGFL